MPYIYIGVAVMVLAIVAYRSGQDRPKHGRKRHRRTYIDDDLTQEEQREVDELERMVGLKK